MYLEILKTFCDTVSKVSNLSTSADLEIFIYEEKILFLSTIILLSSGDSGNLGSSFFNR